MKTECICPNCKSKFDITEIVEPIRRKTLDDIYKEIENILTKKQEDKNGKVK